MTRSRSTKYTPSYRLSMISLYPGRSGNVGPPRRAPARAWGVRSTVRGGGGTNDPSTRRASARTSQLRQRHPALAHVLALAIGVRRLGPLVALEEQQLHDALVRVHLRRQRRRVRQLQRHVALPARLQRRDVRHDPRAGVRRLAQRDDQHVVGDLEVLHGAGQHERVRRADAGVRVHLDEAGGIERLGVDDGVERVDEHAPLGRGTQVVAEAREAVADHPFALEVLDERIDHALAGTLANPTVRSDGHARVYRGARGTLAPCYSPSTSATRAPFWACSGAMRWSRTGASRPTPAEWRTSTPCSSRTCWRWTRSRRPTGRSCRPSCRPPIARSPRRFSAASRPRPRS